MKNLVLSVVLGMFCYCTNNAAEHNEKKPPIEIKDINDVLWFMILSQIGIIQAREAIKEKGKNIYATIKDKNGKVTKESLLIFFKENLFMEKEIVKEGMVKKGIEYLEQYFHLKGKNDEYECTKDNLTEIFWEEQGKAAKIYGEEEKITQYLQQIAASEDGIHECFKKYYYIKKTEKTKEGKEKKKEDIIEEIMNECCDAEDGDDIHQKFSAKLEKLCEEEQLKKQLKKQFKEKYKEQFIEQFKEKYLKDKNKAIIAAIQRRITLTGNIIKDDLRDFIKQKIEPLDEKEGGCCPCCPCCDCLKKNKNPEEDPQDSQHEMEE